MDRRPGEGSGAGEEPVPDSGAPGGGATPDPGAPEGAALGPGLPGSGTGDGGASGGPSPDRGAPGDAADPGLAGFAPGGEWDSAVPSAALAVALEAAAGEGLRCEGGSRGEQVGLVRAAAAVESWACALKLGQLRALIREDAPALPGDKRHGDLPDEWSKSLTHDVALALAMSPISAENLLQTAWDLGVLLPGIGALLQDGTLTYPKARVVRDTLELLSEQDRAAAEAMIMPQLKGKTFGQVEKLAAAAAITVDPDLAERTREHAERNRARLVLKRERSGAATLSGCELPPAETLAAHAAACARAQVYKESGAFPGVLMDQFRAMAYLDLMNGVSAEARIAAGPPEVGLGAPGESAFPDEPEPDDPGGPAPEGSGGSDCPCDQCDGRCTPRDDQDISGNEEPDDGEPAGGSPDDEPDDGGPDDEPEDDGPDGDGPGSGPPPPEPPAAPPASPRPPQSAESPEPPRPQPESSPWSASPSSPAPPTLTDLIIPLAGLLGPPRRPGESHGFGPLDPALSRALAALAAASPHTTACLTVTDKNGYAIGHGCLTAGRRRAPLPGAPAPPLTALPARLNLTISATQLAKLLASHGPPGRTASAAPASPTGWALAPPDTTERPAPSGVPDQHGQPGGTGQHAPPESAEEQDHPGDPDWCGTWTITVPGGLQYKVPLKPVPTHHCDHRRESHAYQPKDSLRHLVQVRDRECTFPTCSRHARESDFEHGVPYDQGGRTCGCNAGARSRACHQVKQSPGWKVTQPKPGWHQWETPSGRTYTQEPNRYPY